MTMNIKKYIRKFIPKEIEFYTKALTALFVIAIMFGFFVASQFPSDAIGAIDKTMKQLSFIAKLNHIEIFFIIFLNNAVKAFLMIILGTLFGVIPVLFIVLNGYTIGVVVSVMITQVGATSVLLGILPHGILEIPAILISAGYGVWLGEMFSKRLRKKSSFRPYLKIALRKYMIIILPIIILSALIETFVTSGLLGLLAM